MTLQTVCAIKTDLFDLEIIAQELYLADIIGVQGFREAISVVKVGF